MPRVSVIVPIFNAQKTLNKCITSILKQSFIDFELILVNDGSTDNSLDVCMKYQKQDSRIILINKKNEGSIAARKKGIQTSNSKYVMFVDADDWIDKIFIETLYNEAVNHNAEITVCNMYRALGSGRLIKRKVESWYFNEGKIYSKEEIKKDLITAYFNGHPFPSSLCGKLYLKEILQNSGNYLDKIHFLGDDLFYNLEMLLKANKVKIIDKTLYYYRVGGFTSKHQPELFSDMVNGYHIQKEVIEKYFADIPKHYNGISIMLLNTFKMCLINLCNSKLDVYEIKQLIKIYVSNESIRECLNNDGCLRYFQSEYLNAIRLKDIEYLYKLGDKSFKRARPRKILISILSKVC